MSSVNYQVEKAQLLTSKYMISVSRNILCEVLFTISGGAGRQEKNKPAKCGFIFLLTLIKQIREHQ